MPKTRATARVAARPDPDAWGDDELMTLAEAAALFWPQGPISERTLRCAIRDSRLPISKVARRFFVTKIALRELSKCELVAKSRGAPATRADEGLFDDDHAMLRRTRTSAGRRRFFDAPS
jgi:hypothetical protein